jgi:hypothetical protein
MIIMENVEKHKYLLQPDKRSDKDKTFSSYLKGSNLVIPQDTDYRSKMPPIWDQGQLGACQSYAIDAIDQYIKGYAFTPSHIFTYYNTRLYEGSPIDQDTGGTLSGTCQAVKKYGICDSSIWSNDPSKFTEEPSKEAYANGLDGNDELVNFYRVNTVDEARQALALGHLPYIGINVYENFETDEVMKTGVIPSPQGQLCGGHALDIVGHHDNKVSKCHLINFFYRNTSAGYFIIRNSWGTKVGQQGYFTCTYEIFDKLVMDMWIIVK